jgi:hypothetical protein
LGCCGQKRADFKNTFSRVMTPIATPPVANRPIAAGPTVTRTAANYSSGYSALSLHYLESSPILVRGTVTGRQYEFSGAHPDQFVDARDAEALLHTRFFRRNH